VRIGIIWLLPFLFVSLLLTLAKILITILTKSRDTEQLCLIPECRGNSFTFSLFNILLTISLSYTALIIMTQYPLIPSFLKIIYYEKTLDLIKAFSASIEMIIWIFAFDSIGNNKNFQMGLQQITELLHNNRNNHGEISYRTGENRCSYSTEG
jgi:hypothetical protein